MPGAWLNQAVFQGRPKVCDSSLVTLPPLPAKRPKNRAQREGEAVAYWDSLTPEQEVWALRKMGYFKLGQPSQTAVALRS